MNTHHPLTLFILKGLHDYDGSQKVSSGLRNSSAFVVEMLLREGQRAKLADAIDGNCIDRIVTLERPARVVIEALWVTPAKMRELKQLHPEIRWTVRIHSEIPFLANEGIAVEWIAEYMAIGVEVAFNSSQSAEDFALLGPVEYLPNYYPLRKPRTRKAATADLHVGCFGAIRPLKNQLIQAFAAVKYAEICGKHLIFHMNQGRIEQLGESNLKNIEALIIVSGNELVQHPWMGHEEFLETVACMDVCLQVSLSESFNIVSADVVSIGVPLVGSESIRWLPTRSKAKPDSVESIVAAMGRAGETSIEMNHVALEQYLARTVKRWNDWLGVAQ